jgi:choline kinase/phosphatidylglycerophosphate synthase
MFSLSHGRSKAMLRLGGLTLLERCIGTLQALELDEIVVIVGHDGDAVRRHALSLNDPAVSVVEAAGWSEGNGRSLAAAESRVCNDDVFLVVTVDHVFPAPALRDLVAAGRPAVLVDHSPSPAELAEGTKVILDDDRVVAFGKHLTSSAIDCGAFVLAPTVFEAHRTALADGDASLAGAVSVLTSSEPLLAVDIAPGTWTDVDVPEDLRSARTRLRRSLGKAGDGPVSTALNRPISTRISMLLVRLPVSPGLVSLLVAVAGFVAAALLATGHGIAGGIAVQAVSVLDGVDGELARLRLATSARGAMLDGMLDRVADAAVIGGMGVWAASSSDVPTTIWLVVGALSGSILSMASKDRARLLGLRAAPELWIGRLLGGRDGRMLLIAVAAVLGRPLLGLVVVAATSLLAVGIRTVSVLRTSPDA